MTREDERIDAALKLAAMGVKIVPLFGINPTGHCTCSRGAECSSAGKHPIPRDWATVASDDEDKIIDWAERYPDLNFGILLGPASGVIDVEFDCEEGRRSADKLFAGVHTLTYTSDRSTHRLFTFDARLPDVQKLTPKAGPLAGLEIRIGGGGASTQSVAPPSRHRSGKSYAWLPTMSPDELDGPASLSREFFAMIDNIGEDFREPAKQRGSGKGRDILGRDKVGEGERNDMLFRFACRQASKMHSLENAEDQTEFLGLVSAMNQAKCDPPLPDREVRSVCNQAWKLEKRGREERAAADRARQQSPPDSPADEGGRFVNAWGLATIAGEWEPNEWRLQAVASDPPRYRLIVPRWKPYLERGAEGIDLAIEQFKKPAVVATEILKATGCIDVEAGEAKWAVIWNGARPRKGPPIKGVSTKLLESAEKVAGDPTEKRYLVVAQHFLDELESVAHGAYELERDNLMNGDRARLFKVAGTGGEIWFNWNHYWSEAIGFTLRHRLVNDADIQRFKREAGLKPSVVKTVKGSQRRFCVVTPADAKRIAELVEAG